MFKITTNHPLAEWSPDTIEPKGAKTDNTVNLDWNRKLYDRIPAAEVRLLDLGCAGGGTVASILADGGAAVGVDGSDYGREHGQGEWPVIPANLFNADITQPFDITFDGQPYFFNVVTMWEVLEHIPEHLLADVLDNVRRHLEPGGIFVCSISQSIDCTSDFDYHVTVHSMLWWRRRFLAEGWELRDDLVRHFDPDWVRGPMNGMISFPMVLS